MAVLLRHKPQLGPYLVSDQVDGKDPWGLLFCLNNVKCVMVFMSLL